MKMEDCLAGRLTAVDADVVTICTEAPFNCKSGYFDSSGKRDTFLMGRVKPISCVPFRDEQSVARTDGECVPKANHQGVLVKNPIERRRAEWARFCGQFLEPSF
jgi:hypothetical protein